MLGAVWRHDYVDEEVDDRRTTRVWLDLRGLSLQCGVDPERKREISRAPQERKLNYQG